MTLAAIETPIGRLVQRAHVAERVRQAWPGQPDCLHWVVTNTIHNPYATNDCLFVLADALQEAAREAGLSGCLAQQAGLTALRHLVQDAVIDRPEAPASTRQDRRMPR